MNLENIKIKLQHLIIEQTAIMVKKEQCDENKFNYKSNYNDSPDTHLLIKEYSKSIRFNKGFSHFDTSKNGRSQLNNRIREQSFDTRNMI